MKTETLFITIFVIAILLMIINLVIKYLNKNTQLEGFANDDYVLSKRHHYQNTIYESSLLREFPNSRRLFCNLVSVSKEEDCNVNNELVSKDRIPLHIIKELKDGKYLAVFNDGKIYRKDNLTDDYWKGPIAKSLPRNTIPLRMITLDSSGEKLLAVAYDNNLYIKKKRNMILSGKKLPTILI